MLNNSQKRKEQDNDFSVWEFIVIFVNKSREHEYNGL